MVLSQNELFVSTINKIDLIKLIKLSIRRNRLRILLILHIIKIRIAVQKLIIHFWRALTPHFSDFLEEVWLVYNVFFV